MTPISLVQFRKDAGGILSRVSQGQSMLLTVRGKPVARLEPIDEKAPSDDPLYRLAERAIDAGNDLSNGDIDRLLYET